MATPPTRRLTDMDITPAVTTDGTDILRNMGRANATLLNNSDKQAVAQKLRDKGWSYRRISETLGVQYILVSRWLNGDMTQPDTPARGAEYYNDAPELKDAKPPAKTKRKTVNNNDSSLETLDDALDMVETLRLQMNAMDKYVRDALKQIEVTTRQWQEREAAVQLELEQFRQTADEREAALRTELAKVREEIGRGGGGRRQDTEEDANTDDDDPFADRGSDDDTDPFADLSDKADDDPFADLSSDNDPFADLEEKPKAKAEDDPFADLNASNDPFADLEEKPKAKAEDDPFADLNTDNDPFADLEEKPKAKAEDDPFADLEEKPKARAEDDPFADLNAAPEESEEKPPEPEPEKPKGLARLKFWGRKK